MGKYFDPPGLFVEGLWAQSVLVFGQFLLFQILEVTPSSYGPCVIPMRIASINGKRYVLVIVDDYSRYKLGHQSSSIRTDKRTEFKNQILKEYFDSVGISHQASSVRIPQQNGVVERRNRTLVEATRTMLIFSRAPKTDISLSACIPWLSVISKKDREDIGKLVQKLSVMAFEQSNSKPRLQSMTSGQISSGLDLTYAPSTITTPKPIEGELDYCRSYVR
ncbi:retrovirus-related pol polyprotein from transposon TNT 1-94 [Tanacetum coccineum]